MFYHVFDILMRIMLSHSNLTGTEGFAGTAFEEDAAVPPACEGIRTEMLVQMMMQNYSRSVAPANPVAVQVETTIQDINELSVMSNSFHADLWFSAIWHDPRLRFSHLDPCRRNLSFDDTFERYLWSPNVCLVNTKFTRVHSSPKPNVLLMIMANGTVWLNYRVHVEAPCTFRLSDFPMDSAQCSLVFESYSYNTATVTINWMPTNAVTLRFNELSETDYQLTYTKYYKHVEYYKAGEWYRLTAEIGFRRRYGYYILQLYAHMYINVFLSWIAFCISLKALPARAILSVNTLMSLCLQFGNIISSLPPVSYVKSIDYFMFICIAFIFASLLEMAFIAYRDKQMLLRSYRFGLGISSLFDFACLNKALSFYEAPQFGYGAAGNCRCRCQCHNADRNGIGTGGVGSRSMSLEPPCQFDNNMMGSRRVSSEDGCVQSDVLINDLLDQGNWVVPPVPPHTLQRMQRKRRRTILSKGHRIDQISFILFPMAFSLFNAIYWTYYLSKRTD